MRNDLPEVDVVVIGSGFGGAAAANRLALAGKRVLVLERGPWRDSTPVRSMGISRRSPFPYGKQAVTHFLRSVHGKHCSLRLNKAGMFEIQSFSGLYTLAASAVGGGSTAWGSLLEKPRNPTLWQDCHPQLEAAAIERYYDKVIDDMGGVRLSREQPLPQNIWDHFPTGGDARCLPADEQPLMAFLFPPTAAQAGQRAEAASHTVERHYSAFDGDSFLGSRDGAKASVDFIYLAPVLGKGVEVRDLCEVSRIRPLAATPGSGYAVEFKDLASGRRESVQAAQVVLAAGTLNSVRLLFASSGAGGLAAMPALGKGFFANGDLLGAWIKPAGSPSSFRCAPIYGCVSVAGVDISPLGVGGLAGFDSWPLPRFVKRFLARVSVMYGMDMDSNQASVSYVKGRLRSDYNQQRESIYTRLREAFRIVTAVSGSTMHPMRKPLSPHAGGGARIGRNAQEGVVDHCGEVYGNPGLFVTDASALPAAPGGPPAVSIAAWAHHVADGIVRRGLKPETAQLVNSGDTSMQLTSPFVSTQWLAEHLDHPALRLFDVSIYLTPNPDGSGMLTESGRSRWAEAHIPGANFIDMLADFSDHSRPAPLMVPATERLAEVCGRHGIHADSTVVIYSAQGMSWAARLCWILRGLGMENVAILDGGWEKWLREGRPTSSEERPYVPVRFSPKPRHSAWADKKDVLQAIHNPSVCLLSAVPPDVYAGQSNPFGRPGHIPGSHNLFCNSLLDPETGTLLPEETLQQSFAASGALKRRTIIHCSRGVSAGLNALALTLLGNPDVAIYDGSLAEWCMDPALPLVPGSQPG